MKLIFPFTYMDQWYFGRYEDQIRALCNNFEKVTIIVQFGVPVKHDIENLEVLINKIATGQNRKITVRIKNFVKKITFIQWFKRVEQNKQIVEHWVKEGIEGDAILSYSGAGLNQTLHCNIGEALGIPVIHRMRGDGVTERSKGLNIFSALISNHFHYSSLKRYSLHIPINLDYQAKLIKWGVSPGRITEPVGLGVDTDQFKGKSKPTRLTLGYFGRLEKAKNIDFLIEVMKQTPNVDYIVLGRNPRKYKFPSNVRYLGYVAKSKMPIYYEQIIALVNPSFSEGFPNVLLEAYATKTPVFGSPATFPLGVPIFGEEIELDVESWVNAIDAIKIRHLIKNGAKARKWVQNSTWEKWGEVMAKHIEGTQNE